MNARRNKGMNEQSLCITRLTVVGQGQQLLLEKAWPRTRLFREGITHGLGQDRALRDSEPLSQVSQQSQL